MELFMFGLVIVALLGYIAWKEWFYQQEIRKLVELSKAKSLEDVVAAEVIRHDINNPPTPPVAGAKTMDALSEDEFEKHIKSINNA